MGCQKVTDAGVLAELGTLTVEGETAEVGIALMGVPDGDYGPCASSQLTTVSLEAGSDGWIVTGTTLSSIS